LIEGGLFAGSTVRRTLFTQSSVRGDVVTELAFRTGPIRTASLAVFNLTRGTGILGIDRLTFGTGQTDVRVVRVTRSTGRVTLDAGGSCQSVEVQASRAGIRGCTIAL